MATTTKRAIAVRDFKDAGTTRTFQANTEYEFEDGEYRNYLAAGLIREPEAKAPAKPAAGA